MKRHQLIWVVSSVLLVIMLSMDHAVYAVVGQSNTLMPTLNIAAIKQTATALSASVATPTTLPALGTQVVGDLWQVSVETTSNADSLTDPFGDKYRADSGSSILLLSVTVQNLGSPAALPDADMLLSGIRFYSAAKAPPSAFNLDKLAVYTGDGKRFQLVGFGVGSKASEFLIAPNLTDFSAAFSGTDPANFTLAFSIPQKTNTATLSFEFEDLPRISLTEAAPAAKPTPTADANVAIISGTLYVSRARNVPMANAEVDLNDPSKDIKSPTYKVATVKTDDAGKFQFTAVKPGRYLLSATWALSNARSLTCSFSGFMTFRDDWLIAVARKQNGDQFVIAVREFDDPVAAGDAVVADMDLACE